MEPEEDALMTDPVPFYIAPQEYDPETPLDTLHEHPENYNKGVDDALAASLDSHGFYGAVLAQRSTGYILAGNSRYRVALAKAAGTMPCFWLDCDDTEARALLANDNVFGKLAVFDEDLLIKLLTRVKEDTGTTQGTGYPEDALAALLRHQRALSADPGGDGDWDGMPDYDNPGAKAAYSVTVHFPTEDDAAEFFKLLSAERPRQRFMWWPRPDGFKGNLYEEIVVSDE